MTFLTDKADFARQMMGILSEEAILGGEEIDSMRVLQIFAGAFVELGFLFEDQESALDALLVALKRDLNISDAGIELDAQALPPAPVLDSETESGRAFCRRLFEEWLDCPNEFADVLGFAAAHFVARLEDVGQSREESYLLVEHFAWRCLAYECAAQELCDVVIDEMIGRAGWSMSECISGLSALAGRHLGLTASRVQSHVDEQDLQNTLESLSYVMTQEAVRLGVPAGTDWRFGLAANDTKLNAPFELVLQLVPLSSELLEALCLDGNLSQAVACAKAAGRMLAVAAGGENPEMEPAIAKPLAMAALTDTYKSVCADSELLSC